MPPTPPSAPPPAAASPARSGSPAAAAPEPVAAKPVPAKTVAAVTLAKGPPRFVSRVGYVPAAKFGRTWRPGCPVPRGRLRLVRLSHWGFDGKVHTGELVLRDRVVKDVTYVFRKAFEAKFPIRKMQVMAVYGGSDPRAMADDNTSAFNCRGVTGNPGSLSQHSYGDAIDINTLENPYVDWSGRVYPAAGARYLNRRHHRPGMIHSGSALTKAFRQVGWSWGARWSNPDYQHFSANGR